MLKWFKKEVEEDTKEKLIVNADIINIRYSGEHKYHLGSLDTSGNSETRRYVDKIRIYLTGEGVAEFSISSNKHTIKIEPFVYLEEYNSLREAYIGVSNMDKDFIAKELQKEVVKKVSSKLEYMEEDEIRKLFSREKITLTMDFEINKSELIK